MGCFLIFMQNFVFNLFNSHSITLWKGFHLLGWRTDIIHFTVVYVLFWLAFKLFFEFSKFFSHTWIPMILYCVVSSTLQNLSNIGPRVAILSVTNIKDPLLFFTPGIFFNHWIQMIMPSFTTLLSNSTIKMGSYLGPFLSTFLLNE